MSYTQALAVLALAVATFHASAEVYRCTDAAGKVAYSDQPCAKGPSTVIQVPRAPDPPTFDPQREGGLLGVLGKQMEDFAEFHKQWYIADMTKR